MIDDHIQKLADLAKKENFSTRDREYYYFVLNREVGKSLHNTEEGKRIIDGLDNIEDLVKLRSQISTLKLYSLYSAFDTVEEMKHFLEDEIREILEIGQYGQNDLSEIKYLWEYDSIVHILYSYIWENDNIKNLGKRNRKKVYEDRQKWEREKQRVIKFCKDNHLPFSEIEKSIYEHDEEKYLFYNRESTIKHFKEIAFNSLTEYLQTGKERAKKIVRLFDFIP